MIGAVTGVRNELWRSGKAAWRRRHTGKDPRQVCPGVGAQGARQGLGILRGVLKPWGASLATGVRGPSSPYHPLHDDDLGPQRLADGENVHQPQAEQDEVQGEDDAPRVQQRGDEPGWAKQGLSWPPRGPGPSLLLTCPSPGATPGPQSTKAGCELRGRASRRLQKPRHGQRSQAAWASREPEGWAGQSRLLETAGHGRADTRSPDGQWRGQSPRLGCRRAHTAAPRRDRAPSLRPDSLTVPGRGGGHPRGRCVQREAEPRGGPRGAAASGGTGGAGATRAGSPPAGQPRDEEQDGADVQLIPEVAEVPQRHLHQPTLVRVVEELAGDTVGPGRYPSHGPSNQQTTASWGGAAGRTRGLRWPQTQAKVSGASSPPPAAAPRGGRDGGGTAAPLGLPRGSPHPGPQQLGARGRRPHGSNRVPSPAPLGRLREKGLPSVLGLPAVRPGLRDRGLLLQEAVRDEARPAEPARPQAWPPALHLLPGDPDGALGSPAGGGVDACELSWLYLGALGCQVQRAGVSLSGRLSAGQPLPTPAEGHVHRLPPGTGRWGQCGNGVGVGQAVRISLSLCPGPPRRPLSPEGVFVHQVGSQRDSGWGLDRAGPA